MYPSMCLVCAVLSCMYHGGGQECLTFIIIEMVWYWSGQRLKSGCCFNHNCTEAHCSSNHFYNGKLDDVMFLHLSRF